MTPTKRSLVGTAVATVLLAALAMTAGAQEDQGRERRDARRFRELQTDLRETADRETKLLAAAVEQARENQGKTEPSTLAELTNVMEQKDRLQQHLRELALRNGWDAPEVDGEAAADAAPTGVLGRMVGRASAAVQARLAEEARAIASRLELPLLPLPPARAAAARADSDEGSSGGGDDGE